VVKAFDEIAISMGDDGGVFRGYHLRCGRFIPIHRWYFVEGAEDWDGICLVAIGMF
jgi:hypothetical protein